MVDNDIFSKSVAPEWRDAARAAYGDVLSERAVRLAIKAAAKAFQDSGFEVLSELLPIVTRQASHEDVLSPDSCFDLACRLNSRYPDLATQIACELLWGLSLPEFSMSLGSQCDVQEAFTRAALARFIVISITPDPLIEKLQRTRQWSSRDVIMRRDAIEAALRETPGLVKLARQLILDPSGAKVTRPRIRDANAPDLRELIESFALTA